MDGDIQVQETDEHGFSSLEVDPRELAAAFSANGVNTNNLPAVQGGTHGLIARQVSDGIITAQAVAKPRDEPSILAKIKAMSGSFGDQWYYEWETKNRDGSKGRVLGPTIKCAMDVARLFGNCQVDVRVVDGKEHWVFYARFVDYETGYSLTRAFQQRKSQTAGKKMEVDRQLDIAFQIGQSKAERNVIVNALRSFTDYAVDLSRDSLVQKIGKNVDASRTKVLRMLEDGDIAVDRVVAVIGRSVDEWRAQDIARVVTSLKTISDGMATKEDIFPTHSQASQAPSAPPAQGTAAPPAPAAQGAPAEPKKEEPDANQQGAAKADEPKAEKAKEPPSAPAVDASLAELKAGDKPAAKGKAAAKADPGAGNGTAGPVVVPEGHEKFSDPQYETGIMADLDAAQTVDDLHDAYGMYEDDVTNWPETLFKRVGDHFEKRLDELEKKG